MKTKEVRYEIIITYRCNRISWWRGRLDKLLDNCNNINLLLLVRAPTPQAGLERIKENMRKFNVCEERSHALTNDNILPGDLNNPEAFLMDPRLDEVTHVINCAAIASFGNNPFIWNVNVTGTLAFARRMAKVAGLKRLPSRWYCYVLYTSYGVAS